MRSPPGLCYGFRVDWVPERMIRTVGPLCVDKTSLLSKNLNFRC